MRKYTIKKGWHTNYFSLKFYLIRWRLFLFRLFKNKKIVITVSFNENALYDFGEDEDRHDWNKVFGITLALFARPNKNAIMMGWRSLYDKKMIQLTPYFNKNFDKIINNQLNVNLYPKEKYTFEIIPEKNNKWTLLMQNGTKQSVEYDFTPFLVKLIAPWFGGNDTDKDGIGGVPNQDVSYNLEYKIIK